MRSVIGLRGVAGGGSALVLCFFVLLPSALVAQADAVATAERHVETGQWAEARRVLEPYVRRAPQDARAAYLLGRAHLMEGNADAGIEWLERAVKLDARNAGYRTWLGNAYGQKAIDAGTVAQVRLARRARTEFETAVSLDPDQLDARFGLLQFYLVAPGVLGGDRRKAREQADEIRRRDPYRGIQAMVVIHLRDDRAAAKHEIQRGMRLYPDSTALHVALASVHERDDEIDAAFDVLEDAVRRAPQQLAPLYQIGRLGAVHGQRLERAEQALRDYLRHPHAPNRPSHANAQWRLGMVLEKQGRTEDARAAYRAALQFDPAHRHAPAALRRLEG